MYERLLQYLRWFCAVFLLGDVGARFLKICFHQKKGFTLDIQLHKRTRGVHRRISAVLWDGKYRPVEHCVRRTTDGTTVCFALDQAF